MCSVLREAPFTDSSVTPKPLRACKQTPLWCPTLCIYTFNKCCCHCLLLWANQTSSSICCFAMLWPQYLGNLCLERHTYVLTLSFNKHSKSNPELQTRGSELRMLWLKTPVKCLPLWVHSHKTFHSTTHLLIFYHMPITHKYVSSYFQCLK